MCFTTNDLSINVLDSAKNTLLIIEYALTNQFATECSDQFEWRDSNDSPHLSFLLDVLIIGRCMRIIPKSQRNDHHCSFARRKINRKAKVNQQTVMVSSLVATSIGNCTICFVKSYQLIGGFVHSGCGAVINLATYKDHASECKAKLAKVSLLTEAHR